MNLDRTLLRYLFITCAFIVIFSVIADPKEGQAFLDGVIENFTAGLLLWLVIEILKRDSRNNML